MQSVPTAPHSPARRGRPRSQANDDAILEAAVQLLGEVGYTRLSSDQAHGLFELVTARYERRPTIVTSNLTFAEWGGLLGDDVLATALLDRLLHHAEVVAINGRSYRMRQRLPGDLPAAA